MLDAITQQSAKHRPSLAAAALRSVVAPAIYIVLILLLHRYFKPLAGDKGPYYAKILLDIGIAVVLAVSLNIVNGFTGQFSIGHAGFMLTGGYIASAITFYGTVLLWGNKQFHGGFLSCDDPATFDGAFFAGGDALFLGGCIVGGVVAALAGYVVGLPSLRLRGDYLAIVTLGFGEIVRVVFQNSADQVTRVSEIKETPVWKLAGAMGQSLGMTGVPFYTSIFWVFLFAGLTVLTAYRIKQSTYGRALLSIREDEIAAEAMGVNTTRFKVRAFVIAAFFAGIAGSLYAHLLGSINAGELGFVKSFDVVIMVVLGGMGSISGSILAAIILTILPEYLRAPTAIWHYALVLSVLVLVFRQMAGLRAAIGIAVAGGLVEVVRLVAAHYEINLADFRMIIYALLLIVMMIVRPQGLFGIHEIWDIFRRTPAGARK